MDYVRSILKYLFVFISYIGIQVLSVLIFRIFGIDLGDVGLYLVSSISVLFLVFIYLNYFERNIDFFKFNTIDFKTFLYYGLVPVVFVFSFNYIMYFVLFLLVPEQMDNIAGNTVGDSNILNNMFVGFFLICIIAPFVEEVVFRGMIQRGLTVSTNFIIGLFVASVLFTLIHIPSFTSGFVIPYVTFIFVAGLTLGYAYYKSNSIFIPIFIHFCINFISFFSTIS